MPERPTIAEERHLLDRRGILEEVQVHKGNFLTAGVLHNSLDASVVHLGEGDLQARAVELDINWGCVDALQQGQEGNWGDEPHGDNVGR